MITITENKQLDINLSDYSEHMTQSQLNQSLLGRRHSVDSNIDGSRQPTFIRTYREVKWKRVNTPSKLLSASPTSDLENPNTGDNLDGKDTESRDYITGTNIIRQRVPIFMTSGDPHGMPWRRFSAGDLIPITGLGQQLPPNGKCLVIRDILPSKLTVASSSEHSSSSTESSTSLEKVRCRSSSLGNEQNIDDIYEFTLIDDEDEDEEVIDDGSDDDEEEEISKTLTSEETTTEPASSPVVGSFSSSSQSLEHAVSLSTSTQKMGLPKFPDLRRIVFENSIQRKTLSVQPLASTQTVVPALEIQSSNLPTVTRALMVPLTAQSISVPSTHQTSIETGSNKPAVMCSLSQPVTIESAGIPAMATSKPQSAVVSTNTHSGVPAAGAVHVAPREYVNQANVSANKLPGMPKSSGFYLYSSDQQNAAKHSHLTETSWVMDSNKIGATNIYLRNHPGNSRMSVRRSHLMSPFIVEKTIPIDLEKATDIRVELVTVPTTTGHAPLVFQRVTYSSGFICCSAKWIAPSQTKVHTSLSFGTGTSPSGKSVVQQSDSAHEKIVQTTSMNLQVTGVSDILSSATSSTPSSKPRENCLVGKIDEILQPNPSSSAMLHRVNPKSVVIASEKKCVIVRATEHDLNNQETAPSLMAPVTESTPLERSTENLAEICDDKIGGTIQFPRTAAPVSSYSVTVPPATVTWKPPTPVTRKWTFVIGEVADGCGSRSKTKSAMSSCKCASSDHNSLAVISAQVKQYPLTKREVKTECGFNQTLVPGHIQDSSSHTTQTKGSGSIRTASGASHTKQSVTEGTLVMASVDSLQIHPSDNSANVSRRDDAPTSHNTNKQFDTSQCVDILTESSQAQSGSDAPKAKPQTFSDTNSALAPIVTDSIESSDATNGSQCHSDEQDQVKTKTGGENIILAGNSGLIQLILMSLSDTEENSLLQDRRCGGSTVAIDNKIEQAMDLVKRHLMYAVREEVEILKQQIGEMMERIGQLEYENTVLRSEAKPETLSKLLQPRITQTSQTTSTQNNSLVTAANLQQTTLQAAAQSSHAQQVVHQPSQQHTTQTVLPQANQPTSS